MSSSGQDTSQASHRPALAIIGGSGMCSFPELEVVSKVRPNTKYGLPSDDILVCRHGGVIVAFLPRHGSGHSVAPHKVPYKANLAALKSLGVRHVFGTCIAGSLKEEIPPGSMVIPDQFVNLTWGRDDYVDTDGGSFIHLPMGEPYCEHLRAKIAEAAKFLCMEIVPKGTVAVIQGPRFSTAAESRWLAANGWDVVNMTQYPECYLARELGMCYASVAAITDYDVGLHKSLTIEPGRMEAILEIFEDDIRKTKKLLLTLIEQCGSSVSCECASRAIKTYYGNG